MLVPFLKIKNWGVLTHFKYLSQIFVQICKCVSVTYISVKLHLVKYTNQSLIQVISLTEQYLNKEMLVWTNILANVNIPRSNPMSHLVAKGLKKDMSNFTMSKTCWNCLHLLKE